MQISRQRKPFCITSMLSATCIMSLERQASQVPAATREIPVPSASKPPRGPEDGDTKGEHHPTSGSNVPFHPFQNGAEWELANFLALHLTKSQISEFFEINLVHVFKWKNRPKPSFDTVDNLFAMLQEHDRSRVFFFLCGFVLSLNSNASGLPPCKPKPKSYHKVNPTVLFHSFSLTDRPCPRSAISSALQTRHAIFVSLQVDAELQKVKAP